MKYGIFVLPTNELQTLYRVAVENGARLTASRIRDELIQRALKLDGGCPDDNNIVQVA